MSGLEDSYLGVTWQAPIGRFAATWHDFDAATGGAALGTELDVSYATGLGDHVSLLLKGARYNAGTFASDTTKVWLMLTATF